MSFIILLLFAAQANVNTDAYPKCNQEKADQGIQSEMNICAFNDFLEADRALNAQWKSAAAMMKQRDKNSARHNDERLGYFDALLESQRNWLKFRDSQCQVEGYYVRGGSMEPMVVSGCRTRLTTERTKQLANLAKEY